MKSRIEERFRVKDFEKVKSILDSELVLERENYFTNIWISVDNGSKPHIDGHLRVRFYDLVTDLSSDLDCFVEFKMLGLFKGRDVKERKQFKYSEAVDFIRNPVKLKDHFFFAKVFSETTKLKVVFIKSCFRRHYVLKNIPKDEFRVTLDSDIKTYNINKKLDKLTKTKTNFPESIYELKYVSKNKSKANWIKEAMSPLVD